MMRKFTTITPNQLGQYHEAIGYIQLSDIGKRCYDINGVIQCENKEQHQKRLKLNEVQK